MFFVGAVGPRSRPRPDGPARCRAAENGKRQKCGMANHATRHSTRCHSAQTQFLDSIPIHYSLYCTTKVNLALVLGPFHFAPLGARNKLPGRPGSDGARGSVSLSLDVARCGQSRVGSVCRGTASEVGFQPGRAREGSRVPLPSSVAPLEESSPLASS